MEFKMIIVFVDEDKTEEVLDAARDAGATGATVIQNARGLGMQKHLTFFGLELMAIRSVLLILVEASRSPKVMDAVTEAGGLDDGPCAGIALEVDVASVRGLSQHIRQLSGQASGNG